jgi:peroxiredoxin
MRFSIERLLKSGIVVLLGALVAVVYFGIRERIVEAGDAAPDFTITTDSGRAISRANFGGKVLVLNFWATWCQPCVEEVPSLSEFQKTFAGSGVVVLGISVDKDEAAYRAFVKRMNPAFLTARDPQTQINADYGTFKYPETYIINQQGKVVQKIIGPTNWMDERMVGYVKTLL